MNLSPDTEGRAAEPAPHRTFDDLIDTSDVVIVEERMSPGLAFLGMCLAAGAGVVAYGIAAMAPLFGLLAACLIR